MSSLSLRNIGKTYAGGVQAVRDLDLEIADKEFIVIVGPSGCGKSTVLRMIAGLEDVTSGELLMDGVKINDTEPKERDIAMVFQNYALFPHMTVRENLAYGLKIRRVDRNEIAERVNAAAEALGISELLDRRPKSLSGGQARRVALGRAIVREPRVFLLDEPLDNLDATLRVQMRMEIIKMHRRLKTTFVYVTHDRTEAMTMGTRIAVMRDGVLQQADTPATLYDDPANLFVASFLGTPQINTFDAALETRDGNLCVLIGEHKIAIPPERADRIDKHRVGDKILFCVRPESVRCHTDERDGICATIDVAENLGNESIVYFNVAGKDGYVAARTDSRNFKQGETAYLSFDANGMLFFDAETEQTLLTKKTA